MNPLDHFLSILVYGEMRWKQRQDENCKVVEILQKSYSFWLYETLQIARINHMRAGYHRSIDHKKNILLLLRQLEASTTTHLRGTLTTHLGANWWCHNDIVFGKKNMFRYLVYPWRNLIAMILVVTTVWGCKGVHPLNLLENGGHCNGPIFQKRMETNNRLCFL